MKRRSLGGGRNEARNKNHTGTVSHSSRLLPRCICDWRAEARLPAAQGSAPPPASAAPLPLSTRAGGWGDGPGKGAVWPGAGGGRQGEKTVPGCKHRHGNPTEACPKGKEGGRSPSARAQAYTVLSITHSELPNVPRAPSRSLSSKGRSMPLTERLRLVQMFETLRGGL